MADNFWSRTNIASLDIALDVSSQAWPIVFLADQLLYLVNAKMSYKRIIVVTTYHLGVDNLWNIWESSILEHFLNIFPVLWKAYNSECFCFLIFVLKFRQSQSHFFNVGNVKTVSNYLALERVSKSVKLGKNSCSAYEDLIEREKLTRVDWKARYSGQQGL